MKCPFCGGLTKQLEADLAEARKERDYFRARADRLELALLPKPVENPRGARPAQLPPPVGRRTWEDLVLENNRKAEQIAQGEREKKVPVVKEA